MTATHVANNYAIECLKNAVQSHRYEKSNHVNQRYQNTATRGTN